MPKQRVLLVCSQHLFAESVELILRAAEDVELIGTMSLEEEICLRIPEIRPNVVVIVDDEQQSQATSLTLEIVQQYPEIPIIRTGVNENVFRIFSTHTLPARVTNLLEAIRNLANLAQDWENLSP